MWNNIEHQGTYSENTRRREKVMRRKNIEESHILYGKEILVGRTGGMPSLNFLNGVKNTNGDLSKIKVNTSVDFASLSGSFIAGVGDFVNLFDLNV